MHRRSTRLAAWLLILAVAASLRLADLETRAMSHDEAIHASLTHSLVERLDYTQDPTYHGPLLYHLTGLSFFLFGDNDATARLPVALVSIAVVLLLGLFRRTLGEGGAMGAALLFSISPILLFYSRYLRNDLFVVAATLVWAAMMFRYLETRRLRWLFWMVVAMTLSFAAKENSFITGAIFGTYTLTRWRTRGSDEKTRCHRAAAADLSVAMFTLVLPFASGAILVAAGAPALWDGSTSMLLRSLSVTALCAIGSIGLAAWWFGRRGGRVANGGPGFGGWARLAGWFWIPQLILFTGLWSAPRAGFVNGVGGSLAYWLEQHGVGRGGQPLFYYALQLALYEFLPVILAAGGLLLLVRHRQLDWSPTPFGRPIAARSTPERSLAADDQNLEIADPRHRRLFLEFLVWWSIASFCAYSVAGERMPWLATHIVLPLVLLGGWFGALVMERALQELRGRHARHLLWAATAGAFLGVTVFVGIARFAPAERVRPPLALLLLLICAAAFAGSRAFHRDFRTGAARGIGIGLLGLLFLLTARSTWQASFVRQDEASELLVYAHSSADLKQLLHRFERLGEQKGTPLNIRYTEDVAWPFAWYLRSYPGAAPLPAQATDVGGADVVLTGAAPSDGIWSQVSRSHDESRAVRTWWPVDGYRSWSLRTMAQQLLAPTAWQQALDVFLFRRYPGVTVADWPNREDVHIHVRGRHAEVEPIAVRSVDPGRTLGGPWGDIELVRPADIAAMPNGGWLVADVGANRVLWLDAGGELVRHWDEAAGEPFREPWGLAVDDEGRVAIADTWNNRIVWTANAVQADTPAEWLHWRPAEARPLYGPRDVAFDADGALWLTDTGNRRVLRLEISDVTAPPTAQVVTAGLEEPVGLLRHSNRVLVAETWARRLTSLSAAGDRLRPSVVPAWRSRDAKDKPYLATLGSGTLLATDPASGRILVLTESSDGRFTTDAALRIGSDPARQNQTTHSNQAAVSRPEDATGGLDRIRPIGITAQPQGESWKIAIADADGGRVLLIDWSTHE